LNVIQRYLWTGRRRSVNVVCRDLSWLTLRRQFYTIRTGYQDDFEDLIRRCEDLYGYLYWYDSLIVRKFSNSYISSGWFISRVFQNNIKVYLDFQVWSFSIFGMNTVIAPYRLLLGTKKSTLKFVYSKLNNTLFVLYKLFNYTIPIINYSLLEWFGLYTSTHFPVAQCVRLR